MGLNDHQVFNDDHESPRTTSGSDRLELSKPCRQLQTQQSDSLRCPRCKSMNTKFCYFNNYNKTQPRHFCKACRRHWTKGGVLRDVPMGGSRKNKRIKRPAAVAVGPTVGGGKLGLDHKNHLILGSGDVTADVDVVAVVKTTSATPFDDVTTNVDVATVVKTTSAKSFKAIGDEWSDALASYTDVREFQDLVSWDFGGGCEGYLSLGFQDLGFSRLTGLGSFETNPETVSRSLVSLSGCKGFEKIESVEDSSVTTTTRSMMMPSSSSLCQAWDWSDVDGMVLADLNKPWEDPHFKT